MPFLRSTENNTLYTANNSHACIRYTKTQIFKMGDLEPKILDHRFDVIFESCVRHKLAIALHTKSHKHIYEQTAGM